VEEKRLTVAARTLALGNSQKTMQLVDLTLPAPQGNLTFDEERLQRLEETDGDSVGELETLRFWESPTPVVVLGRGGDASAEVYEEVCALEKIPILRRASGGGSVVLGPGCLNFSFVLSLDRRPELLGVRRSYEIILGTVVQALSRSGIKLCGLSDLTSEGRKISGNAQKRTRRALLHQGTILYNFDIDLLARFLREPPKQPVYRKGRCHQEFVANVPMAVDEFKKRLSRMWGATCPSCRGSHHIRSASTLPSASL